ncbi:MAG: hypothetical protein FWG99_11825 [Treponema sp.]|nr:hypothetical protein [Treponema sp.]
MTQQAELLKKIDALPPKYFGEVIDFVGYLQHKAQHENIVKTAKEDKFAAFLQLRGIHKNIPGASVDEFLSRCHEDKERELAIEKREQEERNRYAGI